MKFGLKRTLALAALMAGSAGVAHATEGWYVRADVGQSFDASLDSDANSIDLDNGFIADVGAGYTWDSGFRLEAELSYRINQFDATVNIDENDTDIHGDAIAWGLMANLFYDFNRGGTFRPYLGVG